MIYSTSMEVLSTRKMGPVFSTAACQALPICVVASEGKDG